MLARTFAAAIALGVLLVAVLAAACGDSGDSTPATTPLVTNVTPQPTLLISTPAVTRHVTLTQGGAIYPILTLETMLRFYPNVVVGQVEGILQPFDPRPGYLGASAEQLQALQSGPKGAPIPSDELARPPGTLTSIYSVRVLESVAGDALPTGAHFALVQPGGVFEGVAYENEGDSVVLMGSTYLFLLAPFASNNFHLPDGYDKLGEEYQQLYRSSAEARLIVVDGQTKSMTQVYDAVCPQCESRSLDGRSLDDALAIIRDASVGKPVPTPVPTVAPTTTATEVPSPAPTAAPVASDTAVPSPAPTAASSN